MSVRYLDKELFSFFNVIVKCDFWVLLMFYIHTVFCDIQFIQMVV
jgi:hypothetical protein